MIAMLLSCISLISNIEHLFMCLMAISMSFFRKISIQVLCPFFSQVVWFLMLSYMSSLYIFYFNPLSNILFSNIFTHSVDDFSIL